MPGSSKAVHPSGCEIEFFEKTHKYVSTIAGKTIVYKSGTGVVHGCFPEFDPDGKIAEKCALKEGITVEALKAKWKAKGDAASKFGTRVHETCEDTELGRDSLRNSPLDEKEEKTFANAVNMASRFRKQLDICGVEKIVFSPSLKIAGTIDLLARSRKDGSWLIIDHKTNQAIEKENTWNSFALHPLEHIPNTNFYKYALQLNLYQYLLQHEGYVKPQSKFRLFLNHLTEDKAELIELPSLQIEIRDVVVENLCKQFELMENF